MFSPLSVRNGPKLRRQQRKRVGRDKPHEGRSFLSKTHSPGTIRTSHCPVTGRRYSWDNHGSGPKCCVQELLVQHRTDTSARFSVPVLINTRGISNLASTRKIGTDPQALDKHGLFDRSPPDHRCWCSPQLDAAAKRKLFGHRLNFESLTYGRSLAFRKAQGHLSLGWITYG
jgi:hypothetical protein